MEVDVLFLNAAFTSLRLYASAIVILVILGLALRALGVPVRRVLRNCLGAAIILALVLPLVVIWAIERPRVRITDQTAPAGRPAGEVRDLAPQQPTYEERLQGTNEQFRANEELAE